MLPPFSRRAGLEFWPAKPLTYVVLLYACASYGEHEGYPHYLSFNSNGIDVRAGFGLPGEDLSVRARQIVEEYQIDGGMGCEIGDAACASEVVERALRRQLASEIKLADGMTSSETCLFAGSRIIANDVEICGNARWFQPPGMPALGDQQWVALMERLSMCVGVSDNRQLRTEYRDVEVSGNGTRGFEHPPPLWCAVLTEWYLSQVILDVAPGEHVYRLDLRDSGQLFRYTEVPFVKETRGGVLAEARRRQGGHVLAMYIGHDSNLALVRGDGHVLEALELERLTEKRYFGLYEPHRQVPFDRIADFVANATQGMLKRSGVAWESVDRIVWIQIHSKKGVNGRREKIAIYNRLLNGPLEGSSKVERLWYEVDHHISHGMLGLFDSPFAHPLVVSYDGGGNDGLGFIFAGRREGSSDGTVLEELETVAINLAVGYMTVSAYMKDVAGPFEATAEKWTSGDYLRFLGFAGKTMGYAGLGTVRRTWVNAIRVFFRESRGLATALEPPQVFWARFADSELDSDTFRTSGNTSREEDLAASLQVAFEEEVFAMLDPHLLRAPIGAYDGIVLSGGCALNVIANSAIEGRYRLPVHVPAAANDGGLAVGAAWQVAPPAQRWPLQYAGPPLFDAGTEAAALLDGRNPQPCTPGVLAALLVEKRLIAGVVRGRTEFGPRALGHRSLLAWPADSGVKDDLNVLKHRQFWRPCAPMVLQEDALRVFTSLPRSPHMTFAATLTQEAREALPAIVHFDGTARPQVVSKNDDPWLHSLLVAVRNKTGWGVLINTSFNVRGKPILNTAKVAIEIFDEKPQLGVLVIDDVFILRSPPSPLAAAASSSS